MSSFLKCVRYAAGVWLVAVLSGSLLLSILFGEAGAQFRALTPVGAVFYSLPLGLAFAFSVCLITRQGWEVPSRKFAAVLAVSALVLLALSSLWPMGGWSIFLTTVFAFWVPAIVTVLALRWPEEGVIGDEL